MAAVLSRVITDAQGQHVLIPSELALPTPLVEIRRTEQGDLLLHPLVLDRGNALLQALAAFGDLAEEFAGLVEAEHASQPPPQERDGP